MVRNNLPISLNLGVRNLRKDEAFSERSQVDFPPKKVFRVKNCPNEERTKKNLKSEKPQPFVVDQKGISSKRLSNLC